METIKTIEVIKINREINTQGSAPLVVMGSDENIYFAKTTLQSNPSAEIINELLCAYFAQCWNLKVPEFCLIQISEDIITSYKSNGGQLSGYYKEGFHQTVLFRSKQIWPVVEMEQFISIDNKRDLKLFSSPRDFLKIGAFDLWVGNKDRKPTNPNILVGNGQELFDFHPIDHAAAFAYLTNYKEVRDVLLHIEPKNCILSTILAKTISKFVTSDLVEDLKSDINDCIANTVDHMDFIFEQVPVAWGLGKRSKAHLKAFFSDASRNQTILTTFLSYLT